MPVNSDLKRLHDRIAVTFSDAADCRIRVRALADEVEARTIQPTVIIGLGGAGCGIGARLKQAVREYYRGLDHLADMVQFVMLDSEVQRQHRDPEVQTSFVQDTEYKFVGGFSPRMWLHNNLGGMPDLASWWPEGVRTPDENISVGCARNRLLGRLCLYRIRSEVYEAIRTAARAALDLNREAVAKGLLPALDEDAELSFYIISGTCGGTGSGMFLDACSLVRRAAFELGRETAPRRAVLVMPTFYASVGAQQSALLKEARQANGYAFLRELQHFYQHPDQWPEYCFDAGERRQSDEDLARDAAEPATACYLLDDEVAGRVLSSADDIYRLGSDALFQMLTTPMAASVIDMGTHLQPDGPDPKAHAFSSLGLSYVIYPAKTIARCAAAQYIRKTLGASLVRPTLSDAELDSAKQRAERLFADQAARLDTSRVSAVLTKLVETQQNSLPSVASVEADAAKRNGRHRTSQAMKAAATAQEALARAAAAQVRTESASRKAAAKDDLAKTLQAELASMSGSYCLEFSRMVLTHLKARVEGSSLDRPVGADRADAAHADALAGTEAITAIERLEGDLWPNFWQRGQFEAAEAGFCAALRRKFDAEVRTTAAEEAVKWRAEVMLPAIDQALTSCGTAKAELSLVGDSLSAFEMNGGAGIDERSVLITTQYIPAHGLDGAVEQALSALGSATEADLSDLLARLVKTGALAVTPAWQADVREKLVASLIDWAFTRPPLATTLSRSFADVVDTDAGSEAFKNKVMAEARRLADPTWRLNPNAGAVGPRPANPVLVGKPTDLPDRMWPTDLGEVGTVRLEDQRVMVLQLEHGAPLHAMVGLEALRSAYMRRRNSKALNTAEPAHIHKEWGRTTAEALDDIFPRRVAPLALQFALGLFTEWAVAEKKDPLAVQVCPGWGHGVVFQRSVNQFHVAAFEDKPQAAPPQLRKTTERRLNASGGREAAAQSFGTGDAGAVDLFMKYFEDAVGGHAVTAHVREYIDRLTTRTDASASTAQGLRKQLLEEKRVLEEYLKER